MTKSSEIDAAKMTGQGQPPVPRAYQVGPFEVRPAANTVAIGGEERHLRAQSMQVLVYLLQRPNELVSKEQLYGAIWGDNAVTDDALVQCIVDIRKAFGDDSRRPTFVRTIPKGGYSFVGPVAALAPPDVTDAIGALRDREPLRLTAVWQRWVLAAALLAMIVATITFDVNYRRVPPAPAPAAARPEPGAGSHLGVKTDSLDAYHHYALGLEKANALQATAALEHFEQALKADPDFAMAHARIGYTYAVILGLPQRGEGHLARAFQRPDRLREKDRLSILAWYALAKLDFEGAIVPLRALIAQYPDDTESYWLLARTLRGEERWDETERVLTAGLRIDPNAKHLHNELRNLYASTWRLEPALSAAKQYVALSPNEPNAYDSLGLVYQQAGRYAEALASYQQAIAIDPAFDVAVIHIGNTYAEQGRYREALSMYQRHVDLMRFPEMRARGTAAQGWVHFVRGDLDRAWQYVTAVSSAAGTLRYDIAIVAMARGARDRFEAELHKPMNVTNRGSRYPLFLDDYLAGLRAQADGKKDEAIARYRRAITHAPMTWTFPTLDDCLAQGLFDFDRLDEARAEYERLLTLNPFAARYQYRLAQIAHRQARPADAERHYREFLRLWSTADSDAPEVVNAKAWLRGVERGTSSGDVH